MTADIGAPQQVCLTEEHLYFADSTGGKLVRANHDGSSPTIVRSGLSLPAGIAVRDVLHPAGDRIYWTEFGSPSAIHSAALQGGDYLTHATDLVLPQGIAVTDDHIYWADWSTKKVQRVPRVGTGHAVEDLATEADGVDHPLSVTVHEGFLYWGDQGTHQILRSQLDGSEMTELLAAADGVSLPRSLAIVGDFIYWTETTADKVLRARLDGSNPAEIMTGVGANYLVAVPPEPRTGVYMTGAFGVNRRVERVDLDNLHREEFSGDTGVMTGSLHLTEFHVYWADWQLGRIYRSGFDGSDPKVVLSLLTDPPRDLHVTDSHIYWTTSNTNEIRRANLNGTSTSVVHTTDTRPQEIVVHERWLYWSESPGIENRVIRRKDLESGVVSDVVSTLELPSLDVAGGRLYYTDSGVWTAGLSGQSPRLLVAQQSNASPWGIAVTGSHVFWDEGGLVYAARKDGSGPRPVATAVSTSSFAVSHPPAQPGIYWTNRAGSFSSSVRRANFDGSGIADLVTGLSHPAALAVDDFFIYWTETAGNGVPSTIGRAYHDGSGATTIVTTDLGSPSHLACTRNRIFWSDGTRNIIESANPDGTNRITAVSGLQGPTGLDVTDEHLYFIETAADRIVRSTHWGQERVNLVEGLLHPIGLNVTDHRLYWTDHLENSVSSANLDGSGRMILASSLETPNAVAANGQALYWTERIERKIQVLTGSGGVNDVWVSPDTEWANDIDTWGRYAVPTPVITGLSLGPSQTTVSVRIDNSPAEGGSLTLYRNGVLLPNQWTPVLGTSILPDIRAPHSYLIRFTDADRDPREFYKVHFNRNPAP